MELLDVRARTRMKRASAPKVYRVLLPARDLNRSRGFYETLLALRGREVAPGRVYFDCGPVILGILDYSSPEGPEFSPPNEALYFATNDLEGVQGRARKLGCLSPGNLHGDPSSPLGEIVVRPWGERSFYAEDPAGNHLCFVDETTVFTGAPGQVRSLLRGPAPNPPTRRKSRSPPRS
jgi:catechol 2,3-dioxygenase-like lactoylglutathione lyase family enzyme